MDDFFSCETDSDGLDEEVDRKWTENGEIGPKWRCAQRCKVGLKKESGGRGRERYVSEECLDGMAEDDKSKCRLGPR